MKKNAVLLIAVSSYQIFAGFVALFLAIRRTILNFSLPSSNILFFFIDISFIAFLLFFVYTNFYLLQNKKGYKSKFIHFNKWLNFILIFQITLLGLYFYCIIGFSISAIFVYQDKIDVILKIKKWVAEFAISFGTSNIGGIIIGINVIPLVIFNSYNYLIKKMDYDTEQSENLHTAIGGVQD